MKPGESKRRWTIFMVATALMLIAMLPGGPVVYAATEPVRVPAAQAEALVRASEWQQMNVDGFGDPLTTGVSALEVFKGQLYAGATNGDVGGQVWRWQKDGQWGQVSETGFGSGSANAALIDLIVFQGQLYAGMGWNAAPGQVWRSGDGTNWQPVTTDGFGDGDNIAITNFAIFKGMLYAGTGTAGGSAHIDRSMNVISDNCTQEGLGEPGLVGNVTGFAVYNGALYAAIEPSDASSSPIQVWRSTNGSDWVAVTLDGFGDALNVSTGGFAQFRGYLYLGTRNETTGGQIWRTQDGLNWELAVGDGSGDASNIKVESLLVHKGHLYAATFNGLGLQIWRSAEGTNWEQVVAEGFGDSHNNATLWNNATAVYKDNILIGTWNSVTGGEL